MGKGSFSMKRILFSLIAAGLLAMSAFASVAAQDEVITVDLDEVDGSGVEGSARLVASNGSSDVEVLITAGLEDDGEYSASIYEGTCDDPGDVAHELEDLEGGVSESEIDVDLIDLMESDHSISIYTDGDEDERVACGDIPEAGVGGPGEEDDAVDDDDAVVDDDDDAVEDDDDAAVEDDDDAAMDDDDDAVVEDDDAVSEDDDDAIADDDEEVVDEDDDAVAEEDEADDVEDAVVPAAGSVGGPSSDTIALLVALIAGSALGVGVLIRRQAGRVTTQG
jgi:hypothetical protein